MKRIVHDYVRLAVPLVYLLLGISLVGILSNLVVLAVVIALSLVALRRRVEEERFGLLAAFSFVLPIALISATLSGFIHVIGGFLQYLGAFLLILLLADFWKNSRGGTLGQWRTWNGGEE